MMPAMTVLEFLWVTVATALLLYPAATVLGPLLWRWLRLGWWWCYGARRAARQAVQAMRQPPRRVLPDRYSRAEVDPDLWDPWDY